MKIYLAGPCDTDNRTIMTRIANYFRYWKYDVYCPWELKIENAWDYSQEDWAKMVFNKDVEAINNCDVMVMISVGRQSTAGTNWEQGYAYANRKPIYVIQITDQHTSLMTYCGCTQFINSTVENVHWTIYQIHENLQGVESVVKFPEHCETTLT